MLIIYIQLLLIYITVNASEQKVELILKQLSNQLIPFERNNTDDIFDQLDKKIHFDILQIEYEHECFSDYNYLSKILEMPDPQLQFLVLVSGCVVQNQYLESMSGFVQFQQNQTEYKNGYYIRQEENEIVLIAFRTFYHSSILQHQCKFDGFSNQCIKGNDDHILQLGASCKSYYQSMFCQNEDAMKFIEIIEPFKEYKLLWFIFLFYFNRITMKLNHGSQYRLSVIVAFIIFMMVTNWEFVMIISIWKFIQQCLITDNFYKIEKIVLFGTFVQIFTNFILQQEYVVLPMQLAEGVIFLYIVFLIIQIFTIVYSKRISIIVLIYLMNYYLDYLKAMIKLNTLVNNEFTFGMIYLNILIGNLQELQALTFIRFKNSILQILIGVEFNLFTFLVPIFLIIILVNNGHKQLKQWRKSDNRNIIWYCLECIAQIQLSLLYLPLTILSTVFNQSQNYEHLLASCENFYLFWIYFFYFPVDFPFACLLISVIILMFDSSKTFTYIYQEIVKFSKMVKFEDMTKGQLREDAMLLFKAVY